MEGKKSPEEQEACWIQSMRRDRINTFKRVAAANFDAFCRKRDQDIQAGAARRMQTCQGRALSVHDLTQFARNGLLFRLEAVERLGMEQDYPCCHGRRRGGQVPRFLLDRSP